MIYAYAIGGMFFTLFLLETGQQNRWVSCLGFAVAVAYCIGRMIQINAECRRTNLLVRRAKSVLYTAKR